MALSGNPQNLTRGGLTMKRKHDELDVDDNDSIVSCEEDDEDDLDEEEEEHEEKLYIVVRRVGKAENESLEISLASDASVLDLKAKIAETLAQRDNEVVIPVERQRLIFSGRMLRDDTQLLRTDLNMTPSSSNDEDDSNVQKHFVHLTPLPKGVAPSVRTERELSDNPTTSNALAAAAAARTTITSALSANEENLRRARRLGAQQRRRRLRQEQQAAEGDTATATRHVRGLMDATAYHPYALDLASGLVTGTSAAYATTSRNAASAPTADSILSAAVAAEQQARLIQELTAATSEQNGLEALLLRVNPHAHLQRLQNEYQHQQHQQQQQQQQQQQLHLQAYDASLAAAVAAGGGGGFHSLCPFGSMEAAATSGLFDATTNSSNLHSLLGVSAMAANTATQPTAVSLLHYANNQQLQDPAAAWLTRPTGEANSNITAAAVLQDVMTLHPGLASRDLLPDFLDQIAHNAGELATTLRRQQQPQQQHQQQHQLDLTSPAGTAELAAAITLHEQLARTLSSQNGSSFYASATGGSPGFSLF